MTNLIDRLKLVFLIVFGIGCLGAVVYQVLVKGPRDDCEQTRRWYDPDTKVCATPMSVTAFTGRPIGAPRLTQDIEREQRAAAATPATPAPAPTR